MKTPEEINIEELKIGLECCINYLNTGTREEICDVCPYIGKCGRLEKDAIAVIQQLEAENVELKRERDAAVNELKHGYACFACGYFFRNGGTCKGGSKCMGRSESCSVFGAEYSGLYFKWRGPCEENRGPEEEEK